MRVMSYGIAMIVFAVAICGGIRTAFCVVTLDYPGGYNSVAMGIDGNNVVGWTGSTFGFLDNLSTSAYTALPATPLAFGNPLGIEPFGISGNRVVGGYYTDNWHGFIYDLSTSAYTALDVPTAREGTLALGISGNNIVGNYHDSSGDLHGFLYNGSAYLTLDDPNASQTQSWRGTSAGGISGNYVVGGYYDSQANGHGFLYNISTNQYKTLDVPSAAGYTIANDIDGNTVFGEYFDASNNKCLFLYDIPTATYTNLNIDLPGPVWASGGISGNTVVGTYSEGVHNYCHGFVATIPEPSAFVLLAIGSIGSLALTRRWVSSGALVQVS